MTQRRRAFDTDGATVSNECETNITCVLHIVIEFYLAGFTLTLTFDVHIQLRAVGKCSFILSGECLHWKNLIQAGQGRAILLSFQDVY